MRNTRNALLTTAALCLAAVLLAGCGDTLLGKLDDFWTLSCCGAVLIILDLIALIELAGSPRPTRNKVIWALVILFFPYLGCIAYYLFGR